MERKGKYRTSQVFEARRQIFHVILGVGLVFALEYGIIKWKTILLSIIIGLVISYLSRRIELPVISRFLKIFERQEDLKRFPGKGMIFYLIGACVSLLLFEPRIAMASIMVLAFGDSVSHIYGRHLGKVKHPLSDKKFLEGTIAGIFFGFIGAMAFLPWPHALFASSAAMLVEAIEIRIGAAQVDDNVIVPIVSGAAATLAGLLM